ncbi:hypothetical protein SAMN05216370_0142 [Pseudomonas peli]|uniref:Uncharacterized protein n=1 Tax=Pseudomonas peli TaxID=592361 RepID=A0AB37ZG09_9PSED|nr:hypothetical protein SAMN05216370_0142 [Pseudomonas peli]
MPYNINHKAGQFALVRLEFLPWMQQKKPL